MSPFPLQRYARRMRPGAAAFFAAALLAWMPAVLADDVKILAPGAITFKADAAIPGVATALIDGSPKQGPYTVRAQFSQNVKIPAHFHPDARVVTVLSGTYYFGTGDKYDEGAIKGYKAGTVIVVPANTAHYAGSAEDGAVVQESGFGPTGITLTGK
jgi:quercetin dioxygenase-like cupin family protein